MIVYVWYNVMPRRELCVGFYPHWPVRWIYHNHSINPTVKNEITEKQLSLIITITITKNGSTITIPYRALHKLGQLQGTTETTGSPRQTCWRTSRYVRLGTAKPSDSRAAKDQSLNCQGGWISCKIGRQILQLNMGTQQLKLGSNQQRWGFNQQVFGFKQETNQVK